MRTRHVAFLMRMMSHSCSVAGFLLTARMFCNALYAMRSKFGAKISAVCREIRAKCLMFLVQLGGLEPPTS
jgi:hypothetical protein